MMLNGAVGGIRTFMWSQVILAVPLYLVALILRIGLGDLHDSGHGGADFFTTLAQSYFTCFRCLVAGDCNNADGKPIFVLVSRAYGWWFGVFYCFLTVLFSVALFNVIVAIYVENTVAAAKKNELQIKHARLTDQRMFNDKAQQLVEFVVQHTRGVLHLMGDHALTHEQAMQLHLTPEIFEELLDHQEFQQMLRDLDVADEEQHDLFDTLDIDGGGTLDLEELLSGIAK
eukprot:CAMPEP_0115360852 /NCGR_PEP_ID=MMETSP0270-20121206/101906_1 /TAXON_ID=71861 /ORGANISM="Scrippsiella trochoidea, Strain CCMP3099" /LENGTH=228 /DNA_ID=CAMNT_0002783411 /DNA_START=40 /DNA_END=723 /DNA_ORIENTATION=+